MSALAVALLAPLLPLAPPTADELALTTLLAQVAAATPDSDVVTRRDVTQLLELEGNRQAIGCADTSEACAAEIAAALGAELVVRAELSTLDGERSLALTVLHTHELGRTQRALLRAPTVSALGDQLGEELPPLIAAARGPGRARVFVVDVTSLTPSAPAALAWQWPVGGGLVGVGALGLAGAGVVELVLAAWQAELAREGDKRLDQPAALALAQERDRLVLVGQLAWVAGAVTVAGGAVVFGTLQFGE